MVVTVDLEEYDQGLQELQRQYARDALRCIVARAEGTEIVLITADTWFEVKVPWERLGGGPQPPAYNLEVINILKLAGTAATFDLEVRAQDGGTGLDLIYEEAGITPPYHKEFSPPRSVLSEESDATRGRLVFALFPNSGTLTAKARFYARPLR